MAGSTLELVAITINTDIKPRPALEGQDPAERRHLEATADTYDQAYTALRAQLPDGWLMVGISRW